MGWDQGSPRAVARRVGRQGVWTAELSRATADEARGYVRHLEEIGAAALWISEGAPRKEVFAHAGILLAASERIVVASGVANLWARDPHAMANGGRALGEAYPGRFLLGVGVSHAPRVRERGGRYERPMQVTRDYLEAMDHAGYVGPEPPVPVPRLVGALGPRMLRLSAELTSGAHPYFVPVEHTVTARDTLGSEPVLAVEQAVVLETDPTQARAVARDFMGRYLKLDNYRRNLRRLGFTDQDLDASGSDALVDAIIAWGDVDTIRERLRAHLDAGADHVCVQVLGQDLEGELRVLEQLFAREW